jgi:putative ABC transport system permease protein
VTQRTQEIGVRMALGAEPAHVSWLILRRGLVQVAVGVVLGFAGALGVGRLLQGLLVQTTPTDPTTLAGIVIVLVTVAVVACLWPARQATRVDPLVALRYE